MREEGRGEDVRGNRGIAGKNGLRFHAAAQTDELKYVFRFLILTNCCSGGLQDVEIRLGMNRRK